MAERALTLVDEKYYLASQWQLAWRKFRKHRLAMLGVALLGILYTLTIFCEFFAPYGADTRLGRYPEAPPTRIHLVDQEGKWHWPPFVYGVKSEVDLATISRKYSEDTTKLYPISFLARGESHKLWGIIPTEYHLLGVDDPGFVFLFGTDAIGRDVFSRTLYGGRVSLTVGLVGVFLSFVLGCVLGGISGYYGGIVDTVIQRVIEFLMSLPTLPLWMGLSAALPVTLSPVKTYFGISVVLSLLGWTGLARVVRGKLISLREEDFVMAAKVSGVTERNIILHHLLPGFFSVLIVRLTLSIPRMILGETSLSFLGLGIRPPAVSWGVLLKDAQSVRTATFHPWLMIPGLFTIITVFAYNFVGDGLRDAADPYK